MRRRGQTKQCAAQPRWREATRHDDGKSDESADSRTARQQFKHLWRVHHECPSFNRAKFRPPAATHLPKVGYTVPQFSGCESNGGS
jgi:hypothetical protein